MQAVCYCVSPIGGITRWAPRGRAARCSRPRFIRRGVRMAWTLTAMDPTTNRIVWQKQMTYPMGGGSGLLSTAGGDAVHRSQRGDYLWVFKLGGTLSEAQAPREPPLVEP